MNPEPATVLIVSIVSFATLLRSTFGFADAMFAMPLLAVIIGLKTATPLMAIVAMTISTAILLKNWRDVQLKSVWRLFVSSLAGIPLGLLFLKGTHDNLMKLFLALVIIGSSAYNLIKPRLTPIKSENPAYIFGFFAGVLGGAYNTNGPPVVIYGSLRKWSPVSFRATLQGYFFLAGIFICLGHGLAGLWTRSVMYFYLLSLPLVFVFTYIGGRLNRSIPQGKFDRIIHSLLIVIGVFLLIQTIQGMILTGL
ncbi:MAG: sulfite exporter TauE/SafE family protein [Desulfobacterales bacterium]|uniref:Probable membrane transporter protein n=1 Tax=Candidatus Desulfatibia profunda TaxID=2841695 RepID=A0A8J6TKE9_9BACT|nr:sulfite exporter TauE/SafE family protein [Candidatus Desulfatibia profunda]MBL7179636.1 sulfite exporter TauE/SafE family protein [Desulfobacterales bacterium]